MRHLFVAGLLLPCLAACSSSGAPARPSSSAPSTSAASTSAPSTSSSPTSSTTPSKTSSTPPATPAERVFANMSEGQRVGQLLMVDCPSGGVASATVDAVRSHHVGSVILDGTNSSGRSVIANVTAQLQSMAPLAVRLFIETDQEGGYVQRLQGPGFSSIPSGVRQGTLDPKVLRGDARTWGTELRAAGVNVDLAPVLDTVPPGTTSNPPIGDLDRQYGSTPAAVTSHGIAFARGLADAGVAATAKHFPGLGRVAGNTDTTSGVTDTVTTRNDPYLEPFRAAVAAGTPFVMVSTAVYSRIDPNVPAIFSKTIVTGMLRHDLGFHGIVITDDVGGAVQVAGWSVAERAVKFIEAGGDMVLTVVASQAGTMAQALLARADRDPAFKRLVDAAALRVLQAKQRYGLLR